MLFECLERLTDIFTIPTFYIERVITFFLIWVAIFKEKTVWTQFGFGHIVNALIIKITLFWIWEKSIGLRASEWS